ncbi:MAG: hypothetical protein QXR97_00665 [Thermoproteota archaeon]
MPVKEYKTRYVVFESKDYDKLINILKEACSIQKTFFFKIVRKYDEVTVVKCPHKMVPVLKAKISSLESQSPLGLRIIGVSGTLRKAINKFCIRRIQQDEDCKAG